MRLIFGLLQVLAQIELWENTAKYPVGVYFLPKKVRGHTVIKLRVAETRPVVS